MNNEKPSFYAIIPAFIRYDNRLPGNAKLLYGEITALCDKKGYCWASNQYFAELYAISTRQISRLINTLSTYGYISLAIKKSGKKSGGQRYIKLSDNHNKNSFKNKKAVDKNVYHSITLNTIPPINKLPKSTNPNPNIRWYHITAKAYNIINDLGHINNAITGLTNTEISKISKMLKSTNQKPKEGETCQNQFNKNNGPN